MKTFIDYLKEVQPEITEGDWLKKAVDPDHEGFCTPMTKKTCTPKRKALAKRFKKGDIHKANKKKNKKTKEK
jgi:hypothetical protein